MPVERVARVGGEAGDRPRDDEIDLFGITHQGLVRAENQDQFLIATIHQEVVVHGSSLPDTVQLPLRGSRLATMMLVADGVGGGVGGREASQLAVETVTRYVSGTLNSFHAAGSSKEVELLDELRAAALQAHDAVKAERATRQETKAMATTLTLGIAVWPWAYVVQVGDSRCYFYQQGKLDLLTRDQTIAQALVDKGVLPAERAAKSPLSHVLASAIGADEALPEVTRVSITNRSVFLLCTDGLTKHVSDPEIAEAIRTNETSESISRALLALALERGGSDNVTVIVGQAKGAAGRGR